MARSSRFIDRPEWLGQKGPNGRNLCYNCRQEVPAGGPRRNYCDEACSIDYCIKRGVRVREYVHERDKGICSACGLDAHGLNLYFVQLPWIRAKDYPEGPPDCWHARQIATFGPEAIGLKEEWQETLEGLGFEAGKSFWEADHIVPVVRGGGGCGLSNYRTLCVPCHKNESARLAADRARERKGGAPVRPLDLFPGDTT